MEEYQVNPIPQGSIAARQARLRQAYDPELEALAMKLETQALQKQEGGDHYKHMPIQVVEFCQTNELNYCEANVVKYVCRHRKKNGREDLLKAKHYIDLLLELEYADKD